eukprot:scaffold97706_cov21-Tisochrysis_lutea.AAC.1
MHTIAGDEDKDEEQAAVQGDGPRSQGVYEDEEQAMVQGDSPRGHKGSLDPIQVTWRPQNPASGTKAAPGPASGPNIIAVNAAAGAAASARLSGEGEGGAASGSSEGHSPNAAVPGGT